MADTVTLLELRASVRDLGGFDNSRRVDNTKLTESINEAIKDTYRTLAKERPDEYLTLQQTVTVANNDAIALAANFLRLVNVEISDGSTGDYRKLDKVNVREARRFTSANAWTMRYRRQGANLKLHPTPTAVWPVRIWYIPRVAELVADGDTWDGIAGYESLVIAVAIYKRQLRENMPDLERWLREISRLKGEIAADAENDDEEPYYLSGTGPNDLDEDDGWRF